MCPSCRSPGSRNPRTGTPRCWARMVNGTTTPPRGGLSRHSAGADSWVTAGRQLAAQIACCGRLLGGPHSYGATSYAAGVSSSVSSARETAKADDRVAGQDNGVLSFAASASARQDRAPASQLLQTAAQSGLSWHRTEMWCGLCTSARRARHFDQGVVHKCRQLCGSHCVFGKQARSL